MSPIFLDIFKISSCNLPCKQLASEESQASTGGDKEEHYQTLTNLFSALSLSNFTFHSFKWQNLKSEHDIPDSAGLNLKIKK